MAAAARKRDLSNAFSLRDRRPALLAAVRARTTSTFRSLKPDLSLMTRPKWTIDVHIVTITRLSGGERISGTDRGEFELLT
jgi:hypothetical protein